MSEPVARLPYEHTLAEINTTSSGLGGIEALPSGRPRDLDGPTAIGVLMVRSNLAIASALLAVADALRCTPADGPER
ncbi:hypothetical protein [Streptomyces antibioticus]|uniref:Uncharacterized protein n=1 Tax=Streptomyces antibioticus TaxID=1890 RepID=A0AAE6YF41_STRAT|nr:hypothetical protein [Streptomyces antibioticus]OOQ47335.1 hypothetical protein AFM16_31850 [Streptomyces antibioticus]QIT47657.1 hypothetical protein HCX60_32400 [Streptomyces antibioticus]